jgi:hypothetical protein
MNTAASSGLFQGIKNAILEKYGQFEIIKLQQNAAISIFDHINFAYC